MSMDLSGMWKADIGDGKVYDMYLPGTLDENEIGYPDEGKSKGEPIATRFTRKYTFTGEARFCKRVQYKVPEGKRVFLEAERARCLKLLVDGKEIPDYATPSLSTPYIFEVTDYLTGDNELTLVSDNSYPQLPQKAIVYSSTATDETQTNWNGVLGFIRLRMEDKVFISNLRIYPGVETLELQVEVDAKEPFSGRLVVSSEALQENICREITVPAGKTELTAWKLPFRKELPKWDEQEGNLQKLTCEIQGNEAKEVTFGIRTFGANEQGRLTINGRVFFLRGEANCAEFPEEGHPPMSVAEWTNILSRYRSYGVNCMRFHSHCPPDAAFTAADYMGMLMQPELSHWDPEHAFESDESFTYYRRELTGILKTYANHPSFVMLTLGNELHANQEGHNRMTQLLEMARKLDRTRLFANGSNVHYGELGCDDVSDFYTSMRYYEQPLRGIFDGMKGHINEQYPNARTSYDKTMKSIREHYKKPVFGFEVGQFEILPDFEELEVFDGISVPANYRIIKERAKQKGMLKDWGKYVEATGELSLLGYREEVEAALRTRNFSGLSLLGLQDFSGQGTALVGMLNSHLQPKPYDFACPERFHAFFREQLPLLLLDKYTYINTETLKAAVQIANYGKKELTGKVNFVLQGDDIEVSGTVIQNCICKQGELTEAGLLELPLAQFRSPVKLLLTIKIEEIGNTYPIWVYPTEVSGKSELVYETEHFDEQTRKILEAGGTVYLSPPSTSEALPNSIQAQFTSDFWSVGTFSTQEGGMGQLIDAKHPLFQDFPTEMHTNWQWWPMASMRAAILPKRYDSIITEMDSYAFLRPMTQLLECRCLNGKLLFSTMGLQNLQRYPECRALLSSIYRYLESEAFRPAQEIEPEVFETLVR